MDKNKIIEAAAKLVAKGAYDKAIKEYQKVLEADPKDARILQKMGELYQKKNDPAQASQYFIRVAESYSNDGFFLKAVALYKQVLKLNPAQIEVNIRLAELHQQLQLMSEAMAYYQVIANHYDKVGDTRASLDTLKKMVELDPDNVASRIKLGELFAREKMNREALVELKRSADYLKRNNRHDDYLRVAERISALEPENLVLVRELAESYLSRSDHKRALAKLQICFQEDSRDLETLRLLAQAFQGLGQTAKTVSVYKELAKLYSERGRAEEANGVWGQIERLDPDDAELRARQAQAAPPPAKAAPARPAAPAQAPPQAAPAPPPAEPPPPSAALGRDQLAKLLTETDVYLKYNLQEKALEHLRKIFAVDPENLDAHEKAYQIYLASSNQAQASEQLLNVLRLCTRQAQVQKAQPYLATILQENPSHPEVPAFLAVLGGAQPALAEAQPPEPEETILVDASDEEVIVADAPEDALPKDELALQSAWGAQDGEVVEDPLLLSDAPELPSAEFQVLSEEEPGPLLDDEPLATGELSTPAREDLAPASAEILLEEEPVTSVGENPLAAELAPAEEPVEPPPEEEPAAEECEEASFFLDQGLFEEAREILETVLIAFPGHARAQELLARLEEMETVGAQAPAAAEEEPKEVFDLAAELAQELEGASPEAEPQGAAGDEFQYSVEEVFSEFKKGLEKVVKPEDVDTHYDLGIAYKEMGLIDDAIGEFSVARQGCQGKKKEIDCLTMTAMLQVMKGELEAAVGSFQLALTSEHAAGETETALRYELGSVYEQAGQLGKALFHFQRVEELDPRYRDVASRVAQLSAETQPEEDPLPPSGGENGANGAHRPGGSGGSAGQGSPLGAKAAGTGKLRKAGFA